MTISTHYVERVYRVMVLACSRSRAVILKCRGAAVGSKVSIGTGCIFVRPGTQSLGSRVFLEQHVYLKSVSESSQIIIGKFSFLGKGVEIDCQQRVDIGEHVLLSPGCFITDHNHGIQPDRRIDQQECIAGNVMIEDDVWIGANAVILPGVHIGRGAVIGAGAVVNCDVGNHDIVAGVPAQVVGHR